MDCIQRLDDLEGAQPTIVFDVRDDAGNVVSDVKVAVDGEPLADKLDGSPLAVDPGPHPFTFEVRGQTPGFAVPPGGGVRWVTRRFIIREGEKARRERVVVSAVARSRRRGSTTPTPFVATAAEVPPESVPGSGRTTLGMALGAAGVAGIAVGSVFGLLAKSSWSASKSECGNPATGDCNDTATCPIDGTPVSCPNHSAAVSDHDAAVVEGAVSTVSFIAGGALLASAIAVWLTAPPERGGAQTNVLPTMRIMPNVGTRAIGIDLEGKF